MMSKRIACAYIPNFPIEILIREKPSLASRPVALSDDTERKGMIVVRNERAAESGVDLNMTVSQAISHCPNLVVIARDVGREKEISAKILDVLQKVSPSVQEGSPGIYFVNTSGLTLLYKSEKGLANKMISTIRSKLFPVKVGIGKNKFLARVAAEVAGTSNYRIITAGTEKKFLENLSTEYLDLSEDIIEKLRDLGIRTIGDVSDFEGNEMALRFSREGSDFSLRSKGDDPELFSPESLPEKLTRRVVLTYSIQDAKAIMMHVRGLLDELMSKLMRTGHAADRLVTILKLEDKSEIEFETSTDKPTVNSDRFLRQVKHKLGKQKLSSGVNEIVIVIPKTSPQSAEQLELHKEPLSTNVLSWDNLANLPDFRKLCLPELQNSFLPEKNFNLTPFPFPAGKTERSKNKETWNHPYAMHLISGLRLMQPPKEISVLTEDGAPQAIVLSNISRRIRKMKGPWQLSGEWWEQGFDRLYYEIETEDKKLYLLFFDKLSSRWFIHGIFD